MRKHSYLKTVALALPLAGAIGGCILVPEIEKRVVELAVGHSVVVPFVASGSINYHNDAKTVDVSGNVDLPSILSDNGLSADKVSVVKLAGVSYRVTKAQALRTVTGGTVEILRGSNPSPTLPTGAPPTAGYTPLVTAFNASAAATTGWITVPLDPAGVTAVNGLLSALLTEAKGGGVVADKYLTYHVYGVSAPTGIATDFTWEFKLDLTIVGTFETDIVN